MTAVDLRQEQLMSSPEAKVTAAGLGVSLANLDQTTDLISQRAIGRRSGYVCVANVHMAVEAALHSSFANVVGSAFLTTSDGVPLVWLLRLQGYRSKSRVCGRDLIWSVCEKAAKHGFAVGLYGSTPEVNAALSNSLAKALPSLKIKYVYSPPFRPLTPSEKLDTIAAINRSEVGVLLVALGCPKQEIWMNQFSPELNCVCLGVGAAFNFIAGNKPVAPAIIQRLGLEWMHRLLSEPRRLWKRYLVTNALFFCLVCFGHIPGQKRS